MSLQTPETFEERMLRLAREEVPEQLRQLGRLIPRLSSDAAGSEAELAKELGVELGDDGPESVDVEFVEEGAVGGRGIVVQIRDGKVTRVLQRG